MTDYLTYQRQGPLELPAVPRQDRQRRKDTRPGGDHRFIGGSTRARSRHHTQRTARLHGTLEAASAHSWAPRPWDVASPAQTQLGAFLLAS